MKKIVLTYSVLAASSVLFMGCPQTKPVAPKADTEFNSSIEVSHALYAFLDAEQLMSFAGEQDKQPKFYMPVAGTGGSVHVTNDDPSTQVPPNPPDVNNANWTSRFSVGYKTPADLGTGTATYVICADGRKRGGTLGVGFSVSKSPSPNNGYPPKYTNRVNENSIWFRRYGFTGYLSFNNYTVDDWEIRNTDGNYRDPEGGGDVFNNTVIANELTSDKFDGKITWSIKGSFKVKKGNDSTLCSVNLTKVLRRDLLSTSIQTVVYGPATGGTAADPPIKWGYIATEADGKKGAIVGEGVKVGYYGTVTGITSDGKSFNYEIKESEMLIRDFGCYPDKISSVNWGTANTFTLSQEEYHPFISGIASFTTDITNVYSKEKPDGIYPRRIYYGGEDGSKPCDNSGTVLIKGISYPIDFIK